MVKAVLSKSSDDSKQALGMTVITSAYGTRLVLGPAVAWERLQILFAAPIDEF